MAYPDKNRSFRKSVRNALEGFILTLKMEKNFRIQISVAVIVILAGIVFNVSKTEWLILLLTMFIVLALELMNTAVEKAVDLVTSEIHPLAKWAKDTAAASVLLFSIGAAIIGCIIFLPKIIHLFAG